MSENEIRDWVWKSCTKHVIAAIEEYASGWTPNGSSAAAAAAIVNKIRAMPTPGPKETNDVVR